MTEYVLRTMRSYAAAGLMGFFLVLACIPLTGEAVSGILGDQSTTLYRIEYTFTAKDADVTIPIMARRGAGGPYSVRFDILYEGNRIYTQGDAVGIILSNAPLTADGLAYRVPAGTSADFEFVVLHRDTLNKPDAQWSTQSLRNIVLYLNGGTVTQKDRRAVLYLNADLVAQ